MHGPSIGGQHTIGLLQDLMRVISPQRFDSAEWSKFQGPHEHPQETKVDRSGRHESRFSNGIQLWARTYQDRTAVVEVGMVMFGEVSTAPESSLH